jgi:outer membrane immunogenic protein
MRRIGIVLLAAAGIGLSGAASAADLGTAPIYKKAPAAMPFTWTGAYIGAYIGGATGAKDAVTNDPVTVGGAGYNGVVPTSYGVGSSFIGGYTGGYNWQIAPNWVIGYEGETGYMRLRGSAIQNPAGLNDTVAFANIGDWYSVWTARLGYAVDRSLFYVKGGALAARVETGAVDGTGPTLLNTSGHRWQFGYAVGGGWEYAIDPKWSVKAEYLYLGLDRNYTVTGFDSTATPFSTTTRLPGIHTGKVGVNYKFDWFGLLR